MTELENAYVARLAEWERQAIGKVRERILDSGGKVIDGGLRLAGTLPELGNDLLELRRQIADFGREEVQQELGRQG